MPAEFSLAGGVFATRTQVSAQTAEHPYWHDLADRERYSIDQILIGRGGQETFLLQRAHGDAIAGLVVNAMEARARGDWPTAAASPTPHRAWPAKSSATPRSP